MNEILLLVLLTIARILSLITSWLFPASIFAVIASVIVDLLKKRFYWSKFALIFFVITVILLVIQIKLIYRITGDILNNSSNEAVSTKATQTANWKTYKSGQNIDGISINYPRGWQVNYKKEYNLWSDYRAKYRLVFDFAPPEWKSPCGENTTYMCWGIMSFDIYDFQTDVNQFITKAYPDYKDKLVVAKNIEIGGRPTFLLEGKEDFYWEPRNIVLGSDYSYETSYGQDGYVSEDGKVDYIDILKAKIFPQIYIK